MAGPDQSVDNPIGVDGLRLHDWHFHPGEPGYEADAPAVDDLMKRRGAYVMGRNMFGPVRGEWEGDWRGWWVTNRRTTRRSSSSPTTPTSRSSWLEGRRSTSSPPDSTRLSSRHRPRPVKADVAVAGGASTVRQALAAGALDEIVLDIVPVLLGSGERLFGGPGARAARGDLLGSRHPCPLPGRWLTDLCGTTLWLRLRWRCDLRRHDVDSS